MCMSQKLSISQKKMNYIPMETTKKFTSHLLCILYKCLQYQLAESWISIFTLYQLYETRVGTWWLCWLVGFNPAFIEATEWTSRVWGGVKQALYFCLIFALLRKKVKFHCQAIFFCFFFFVSFFFSRRNHVLGAHT